jgi:hypothetical protein
VEHEVDSAEHRDRLVEQALDVEVVGEVGADRDGAAPAARISSTTSSARGRPRRKTTTTA